MDDYSNDELLDLLIVAVRRVDASARNYKRLAVNDKASAKQLDLAVRFMKENEAKLKSIQAKILLRMV